MKEQTRQKIEEEIEAGKMGIARDRLHGLVLSFPEDLELRSRLGDVYWKLGYPVEAGRYWFLDPSLEGDKSAAVESFVRSCGSDAELILKRLRLRNDVEGLDVEARARLEDVLRRANASLPPAPRRVDEAKDNSWVWIVGCATILLSVLTLTIIGAATVLDAFRTRG